MRKKSPTHLSIQSGDIWLVRFHPGTGSKLTKYRPAIIISDLQSIDQRFTLIAPLTSNTDVQNEYEFEIKHHSLDKPSLLLGWYLWTIDTRRLVTKLGSLNEKEFKQLSKKISHLL